MPWRLQTEKATELGLQKEEGKKIVEVSPISLGPIGIVRRCLHFSLPSPDTRTFSQNIWSEYRLSGSEPSRKQQSLPESVTRIRALDPQPSLVTLRDTNLLRTGAPGPRLAGTNQATCAAAV